MQTYDLSKRIKIFYIDNVRQNGFVKKIKTYIHPEGTLLSARFKNLKADQVIQNKQAQVDVDSEFIVMRRNITEEMFIEYNRRTFGVCTYQIKGIDPWDDNSNYLKLSTHKVNSVIEYDDVKYKEFDQ